MNPGRTWLTILITMACAWSTVAALMWWTRDSVSSPEETLALMQAVPWQENPNLNDALRSAYLEKIIHKQNLLDVIQRRSFREDGTETIKSFFDTLSETEQHHYVDSTALRHLQRVVRTLNAIDPEERKAIASRLRRFMGRPAENSSNGDNNKKNESLEEWLGIGLEMQYHDSTAAKKLEMAEMLESMESFLQGFRR